MKKFLLYTILSCFLVLGTVGCGNKSKEVNAVEELNKTMSECLEQSDEESTCVMNWTLQEYLTTYSDYRLLNASQKEFTAKPQEPNSLFTYGTSRDSLCAYKYALFYNNDNEKYYSITFNCNDKRTSITFNEAKELK